jgi:hypothetical protein
MPYNKDSGESRLRRNTNPDVYTRKTNKNIFKNSQASSNTENKIDDRRPQNVVPPINTENKIDDRRPQNVVPPINEFELDGRRPQNINQSNSKPVTVQGLSYWNLILLVVANGLAPVLGGVIFYHVFLSKGERQKAAQSILVSAIVSFIRILYILSFK